MGRIAHAGFKSFAHCTASRLAGGHILTAAHCLPKVADGAIHLGLGYDRGAYMDLVSAQGTDYVAERARDVALLCGAEAGPGLPMADAGSAAPRRVTFWGYGRPYVHVLNRKTCAVTKATERQLLLDCAATPGYSGGPVTVGSPPRVVGLVSRASRTETVVERLSQADIDTMCSG
ncbi:MAG: trypsin-like peptidase domain-containing protein [Pseudomonadota bacterium]